MGKRKTERNEPYTIEDHERYLAQQEEAREKRAIEAKEAALKLQARAKWAAENMDPADFDREWPSLRQQILEEQKLAQAREAAERDARVRQSQRAARHGRI
jgi:hypothetical protein